MLRSLFWRHLIAAFECLLLMILLLPMAPLAVAHQAKAPLTKPAVLGQFHVPPDTAFVHQPNTALTMERVWTRDGNGNDKSSFNHGDAIQYTVIVDNTSGNTITATFHWEDYWGKINDGALQTFDHIFSHVSVPTGRMGYYITNTTVPTDALPGTYTDRVYVWDENNRANQETGYGSFSVIGQTRLDGVPFYTQYAGQNTQNNDCGPASVAMVLTKYGKGPGGSGDALTEIRTATGNKTGGDTNFAQLETALSHYGSSYYEISNSSTPAPDFQVVLMARAIKAGQPVIALLHGADLGRGEKYGDHWVDLTGFSSDGNQDYALLNDPDDQSPKLSGWVKGGKISLSLSIFRQAAYDAQNSPYGIVVTS